MREEEKKLIEKFKNLYIKEFNNEPITNDDRLSYIECALITNLIEELDKELNNLKEIEKSHKEENGKLRVEIEKLYQDNLTLVDGLKQEKEKNKELKAITKTYNAYNTEKDDDKIILADKRYFDCGVFSDNLIPKSKIREKIVEIINSSSRYNVLCKINENEETRRTRYTVAVLKELLEENNG